MERFEIRKHKHSESYPYDNGYSVWDTVEDRCVGWWADQFRAAMRAVERNEQTKQANAEVSSASGTGIAKTEVPTYHPV